MFQRLIDWIVSSRLEVEREALQLKSERLDRMEEDLNERKERLKQEKARFKDQISDLGEVYAAFDFEAVNVFSIERLDVGRYNERTVIGFFLKSDPENKEDGLSQCDLSISRKAHNRLCERCGMTVVSGEGLDVECSSS